MTGFSVKMMAIMGILGMVSGCSGQVYTIVNPQPKDNIYDNKNGYAGVLFYLPNHFFEISWTTAIIKEGKVTHTVSAAETDKKCIQQIQLKEVVRADFNEPYQLVYAPGFLEKYTWKAEFDQGILKSINADSTPDRGETLKNLASAAKDTMTSIAGGPALEQMGSAHCTDLPQLTYIVKVSEVCPKGQCSFKDYPPKPELQKPEPRNLPVR